MSVVRRSAVTASDGISPSDSSAVLIHLARVILRARNTGWSRLVHHGLDVVAEPRLGLVMRDQNVNQVRLAPRLRCLHGSVAKYRIPLSERITYQFRTPRSGSGVPEPSQATQCRSCEAWPHRVQTDRFDPTDDLSILIRSQHRFDDPFSEMLDSVFDRLRFKGRTERVFQLFSSRMGNGGFPCDRSFVVGGSAGADPLIDLGELELPQAADPVSRQPLVLDPTVDRRPWRRSNAWLQRRRRPMLRWTLTLSSEANR